MKLDTARAIADAVLYEGYLLYPYRSTSSKNQMRWQYGIVGPAGGEEAGVGEESALHTECLLEAGPQGEARVDVHLRFLQIQARVVEASAEGAPGTFAPVPDLQVGPTGWVTWDEAVEHEVAAPDLALSELAHGRTVPVRIPGGEETEVLRAGDSVVGRIVRRRCALTGELTLTAVRADDASPLVRLRAQLTNVTAFDPAAAAPGGSLRDGAVRQSFVGTHLLLGARDSAFVSLIDPPPGAAAEAARCVNRRCWPVLIGSDGDRDTLLASPIILYDYPQIAPESPGALYDSTEIDEILTLRIMTLTDEEKAAARSTDPRAADIIDRSDLMPPEVFEKLHGALRGFGPADDPAALGSLAELALPDSADLAVVNSDPGASVTPLANSNDDVPWFGEAMDASVSPETDSVLIGKVEVSKGSRVRIRPTRRADAQDIFLTDKTAVVTRVYSDVDGNTHVAVTLEDDPASEFHDWYGRYYYFGPEELEPLQPRRSDQRSERSR